MWNLRPEHRKATTPRRFDVPWMMDGSLKHTISGISFSFLFLILVTEVGVLEHKQKRKLWWPRSTLRDIHSPSAKRKSKDFATATQP